MIWKGSEHDDGDVDHDLTPSKNCRASVAMKLGSFTRDDLMGKSVHGSAPLTSVLPVLPVSAPSPASSQVLSSTYLDLIIHLDNRSCRYQSRSDSSKCRSRRIKSFLTERAPLTQSSHLQLVQRRSLRLRSLSFRQSSIAGESGQDYFHKP